VIPTPTIRRRSSIGRPDGVTVRLTGRCRSIVHDRGIEQHDRVDRTGGGGPQ
jgi:hypothetical protein